MTRQEVRTEDAPRPAGAYSQGIVANGFLHTAGFGPQDPSTGAVADTIEEQTAQVIRNVEAVLAAQGLTLADVVKATVHLQHLHRDFAGFNATYESLMPKPYPVRTTVGSDLANILVEIDVVAALRDGRPGE
jgi:reactive intermediate/imine deaminase